MGFGPVGYSLGRSNLFFFCKLIWQIILENGDDCPGKTFATILEENKNMV